MSTRETAKFPLAKNLYGRQEMRVCLEAKIGPLKVFSSQRQFTTKKESLNVHKHKRIVLFPVTAFQ